MKIRITELKTKSKRLKLFRKKEWGRVHPEHFGTKQDADLWKYNKFTFIAEEGNQIIGSINGDYLAGVMFIDQLIIKYNYRGKGIGKTLMEAAEKLAHKKRIHKIYLKTGIDWKAVGFYESLGYKKEARINNFYEQKDFWIITKDLK